MPASYSPRGDDAEDAAGRGDQEKNARIPARSVTEHGLRRGAFQRDAGVCGRVSHRVPSNFPGLRSRVALRTSALEGSRDGHSDHPK